MNVGNIVKEAYEILRKNLVLVVPPLVVSIVLALLMMVIVGTAVMKMGETRIPQAGGGFVFLTFIGAVISFTLHALAQGVTISMAGDIKSGEGCNLKRSFDTALSRLSALIGGGLIFGVLVTIGMALLFIPGLVVALLFMFTFVAIMEDEEGAVGGLKRSFSIVKENFGASLSVFIVLIGIGLLVGIVNAIIGMIPLLGQLLSIFLMGAFFSYTAVTLVLAYRELMKGGEQV
ncbi:MAG: hypothetical protein D6726_00755 [Nitrospirae bacterium]|nr:MAG: hypothetical protein D6726_00755 [Nitrospirota bacterium]